MRRPGCKRYAGRVVHKLLGTASMIPITYILPIRSDVSAATSELSNYLRRISALAEEVIVVDGSPDAVYKAHDAPWSDFVLHVPPEAELSTPMGKVGGVLTGIRRAGQEKMVIADDDVRYNAAGLSRVAALLEEADVVRPQNYFSPMPWHACLDTARILLNRIAGGDWPGTLGVRRSVLLATGGYAGDVMFENLELVRTVRAAGGREAVPLDLYVRRRPPITRHFLSQRIRQAYDELARPGRLAFQLTLLPLLSGLAAAGHWLALGLGAAAAVAVAETGRLRADGRSVFPARASFWAPVWLIERALTSWLALGARIFFGGVRYGGSRLCRPASSMRELRQRHAGAADPGNVGVAKPSRTF